MYFVIIKKLEKVTIGFKYLIQGNPKRCKYQ